LPVDEVADAAAPHDQGCGYRKRIEDGPERSAVEATEHKYPHGAADDESVRGETAKPDCRNPKQVLAVERPFVDTYDQGSSADQHADAETQREVVDRRQRESERTTVSSKEQMGVEKAQRVAQAIPPEADATDRSDDRIDVMNVGTEQFRLLPGNAQGEAREAQSLGVLHSAHERSDSWL